MVYLWIYIHCYKEKVFKSSVSWKNKAINIHILQYVWKCKILSRTWDITFMSISTRGKHHVSKNPLSHLWYIYECISIVVRKQCLRAVSHERLSTYISCNMCGSAKYLAEAEISHLWVSLLEVSTMFLKILCHIYGIFMNVYPFL